MKKKDSSSDVTVERFWRQYRNEAWFVACGIGIDEETGEPVLTAHLRSHPPTELKESFAGGYEGFRVVLVTVGTVEFARDAVLQ